MTRHTLHRVPTVVRHYARREDLALNQLHSTHRVTVTEGAFLFVISVFVFMLVTVAVAA